MTTATTQFVLLKARAVAQHPDNLRDPGRNIDDLASSIRDRGVLVPLIVVPVGLVTGHKFPKSVTHVAVDGSRRQAAAVKAGADLPCIVRDDLAVAKEAALTMAATALQRDQMTPAEEAHAVQAMFDLGLTQSAIAKATGRKAAEVKVAKSAAALAPSITEQYELTLDQMALLAEFQDNADDVEFLVREMRYGRVDHAVSTLRDRRADRVLVAAATPEYLEQGYAIHSEYPNTWREKITDLSDLVDGEGNEIDEESHAVCPGRAVYVTVEFHNDEDDWDGEGEEPEPTEPVRGVTAHHYCSDPREFGHRARFGSLRGYPAHETGPTDLTPAQEAEREQAAAAARAVRLTRKAFKIATTVRRAFLADLLAARSTLTLDERSEWALMRLMHTDRRYSNDYGRDVLLGELLGTVDSDAYLKSAAAHRHLGLVWAQLVAGYELDISKGQYPDFFHGTDTASYFRHLQSIGYALSETELAITEKFPAAPVLARSEAEDEATA